MPLGVVVYQRMGTFHPIEKAGAAYPSNPGLRIIRSSTPFSMFHIQPAIQAAFPQFRRGAWHPSHS